jgi:hypothetical protein
MQIAPHATVSNVTMQVLRNVQDADRKLQVVVDTETHEEVTLFGSWPMVSESKHSTSRTVSLAADARTEGVMVTLEEAKNEEQKRELLIKIPREVVTSPTASEPVKANAVNEADTASSSTALDSSEQYVQTQDSEVAIEQEHRLESYDVEGDGTDMGVEEGSQGSSEVSVEDVESDDEDYDAAR